MTTSASRRAAPGNANPTPSLAATAPRAGLRSTTWTSQPGIRPASQDTSRPTVPPPITDTQSPGRTSASQTILIAVSTLAASTARAGGTSGGIANADSDGTT